MENSNIVKDEDYKNIRLDLIPYLLNERGLEILKKMGISTIGELFAVSDDKDFDESLLNESVSSHQEIMGVIRLLKCKYLGIDPLFDFDYEGHVGVLSYVKIGISIKASAKLARGDVFPKRLLEIVNDEFGMQELLKIRNVGDSLAKEIMYKGTIIAEFYNKKNGVLKSDNNDEILKLLKSEIEEIDKEIQKLNNRTKTLLAMVQEKIRDNQGGITR